MGKVNCTVRGEDWGWPVADSGMPTIPPHPWPPPPAKDVSVIELPPLIVGDGASLGNYRDESLFFASENYVGRILLSTKETTIYSVSWAGPTSSSVGYIGISGYDRDTALYVVKDEYGTGRFYMIDFTDGSFETRSSYLAPVGDGWRFDNRFVDTFENKFVAAAAVRAYPLGSPGVVTFEKGTLWGIGFAGPYMLKILAVGWPHIVVYAEGYNLGAIEGSTLTKVPHVEIPYTYRDTFVDFSWLNYPYALLYRDDGNVPYLLKIDTGDTQLLTKFPSIKPPHFSSPYGDIIAPTGNGDGLVVYNPERHATFSIKRYINGVEATILYAAYCRSYGYYAELITTNEVGCILVGNFLPYEVEGETISITVSDNTPTYLTGTQDVIVEQDIFRNYSTSTMLLAKDSSGFCYPVLSAYP